MHPCVCVLQICASGLFAPKAMRSAVVPLDPNVYEELLQVMPHACLYEWNTHMHAHVHLALTADSS